MKKIEKLDTSSYGRMFFTSDIHGNYEVFKGLLEKTGYNNEKDALFIAGDLVFKGPESLKTLQYILELRKNGIVHSVMGNCDYPWLIIRDKQYRHQLAMAKNSKTPNLIQDMCNDLGIDEINPENTEKIIELVEEKFGEELDYLQNLPHIIEAENFILTHDGLRSVDRNLWAQEDIEKINSFMDTELVFDKYVIVGHLPVDNYSKGKASLSPVINREKKIISLDGGNVVKNDGQLNCIIVENNDFCNIETNYYDLFPVIKVKSPQQESVKSHYIKWPDSEIEIIDKGDEFSLCRQISTNAEMQIPNEFIFIYDGKTCSYDISDYEIGLEGFEEVGLVKRFSKRSLIKKNGVVGWASNDCLELG